MATNVNVGAGGVVAAVGLALAGAGAFFLWKNRKVIADKLNPASDQNLAYTGANELLRSATGDPDATVGTKAYDLIDSIGATFRGWFGVEKIHAYEETAQQLTDDATALTHCQYAYFDQGYVSTDRCKRLLNLK